MAVGEAQRERAGVADRREIDPQPLARLRHDEAGVLDAVLVLVEEDERLARRRDHDLAELVPAGLVLRVRLVVHVGAHRDAPRTFDLPLVAHRRAVGRTPVDPDRLVVREQQPALDVGGVDVGVGVAGHPRPRRRVGAFASAAQDRLVGRQAVGVVAAIEHPRQAELPIVAQALGLERLALGLAQRGQEHPGQDRDDGDHHQELDEGESGSAGRSAQRQDREAHAGDIAVRWAGRRLGKQGDLGTQPRIGARQRTL